MECPQKFWYRLTKSKESESTLPMRIGNIVHRLLEVSNNWETTQEGLILASSMLDDFDLSGYDVNKLIPYIEIFNNYWRKLTSPDDLIEHSFKFPIDTDVYLVGKFDRVLKKSNTLVDWKTNKEVPASLKNSTQFLIYDEAYRIIYGKRPESVVFASLVQPTLIPYQRNESRVSVVFDEIMPKIIHDWRHKNYARFGMFTNKCHNCAFKTVCYDELEYYKDELDS